MYIVFEGVVGVGKTTQSKMLVERLRQVFPDRQIVWTREPGGSEIADTIRNVVQGQKFSEEMDPLCEMYLYAASRAHTLRTVVKPVLDVGGIVVADRSVFTSVSWQGYGRALGAEAVLRVNAEAVQGILPDVVLYLAGDIDESLKRTFDAGGDKFEAFPREFFHACARGYEALAHDDRFAELWETLPSEGTKEEVHERIVTALKKRKLIP